MTPPASAHDAAGRRSASFTLRRTSSTTWKVMSVHGVEVDGSHRLHRIEHNGPTQVRRRGVRLSRRRLDLFASRSSDRIGVRQAAQRDEIAIPRWRVEVWAELCRQASRERRTLVFIDEAGFYMLPGVVRTFGPKGETPIVEKRLTRDHLSVMAGVTPTGKLDTLVRQTSLSSSESVVCLKHLLTPTGKKLLVIWDGSPIHRCCEVREYLETRGGKRIHTEMLPGYAPDLSPFDQGCWHHLKLVEMRNRSCMDMKERRRKNERSDALGNEVMNRKVIIVRKPTVTCL